jgi:anti-anti-sigma regulatory factor
MDPGLDIAVHLHGQVVVIHPRGLLTVRTAADLRRVLVKELVDHGRVIVDLDGFQLTRESCVAVFPAVLTQCGGWPSAKVALCRPDPAMAQALAARQVSALVPVYHLRLEAEAAIDERPAVVRMRAQLPCDAGAPAMSRRLVREMCPKWQVDDGVEDTAEFVVSELGVQCGGTRVHRRRVDAGAWSQRAADSGAGCLSGRLPRAGEALDRPAGTRPWSGS